jgi:hypothetical protein
MGLVEAFLLHMENTIPEDRQVQAMDVIVRGTPTRWWETHHMTIQDWAQVAKLIKVRFHPISDFELANMYKGTEDS